MERKFILYLTIGIPGSGKSRWVKKFVEDQHHKNIHVISSDALRREILGDDQNVNVSQHAMIHDEERKRIKKILSDPSLTSPVIDIIIDATNCDVHEWEKFAKLNPTLMIAKVFDRDVEQSMKNQTHRERKIPEDIVKKYHSEFTKNKKFLSQFFNIIDFIPYEP